MCLRSIAALGVVLALASIAGCGGTSDATPAACLGGPGAYLRALERAPAEVRLSGGVPISDCLADNQQGGDLATVGTAMLEAATALSGEARENPAGPASLQLGYLVGATRRGAEETEGIHAELLRRLTAAGRYSPDDRPLPRAFVRSYRRGYDAGLDGG